MTEAEIILQIKLRRKVLKLSQVTIAEKLHISVKAYQNIEQGHTRIDIVRLKNLANILQIDLQALLFPNHLKIELSKDEYFREKEGYQKIIRDKENYISHLEEKLLHYRNVLKNQNCL